MTRIRGLILLVLIAGLVFGAGLGVAKNLRLALNSAAQDHARLKRDIAQLENRLAALSDASDQTAPGFPALLAKDQIAAELELQARILDLASKTGVALTSFGVSQMPIETEAASLGYQVEFESGHDAAMALIHEIEMQKPEMAIYTLWLRHLPAGTLGDVATPVSVQMTLWSYWVADLATSEEGN